MQQRFDVRVAMASADGTAGPTVGRARAFAPDFMVMSVADRGAMPTLPLLVLVPVAAGGGRDERTIPVAEIQPAEDGEPYVGLTLSAPLPADLPLSDPSSWVGPGGDKVATTGRIGALAEPTTGQVLTTTSSWFCRLFPWRCQ